MAPLMLPPILSFISLTTPPYFEVMPPTTLPTTLPTAFLAAPAMLLHRELLSQAITNLIDNALKHAAGGGVVTLRLTMLPHAIAIQVEDRGIGIAEADRAQALKRFGRLDAARTTPGAGLGMALIEAVARLHNGRFELADNGPGLIARIVLPA